MMVENEDVEARLGGHTKITKIGINMCGYKNYSGPRLAFLSFLKIHRYIWIYKPFFIVITKIMYVLLGLCPEVKPRLPGL